MLSATVISNSPIMMAHWPSKVLNRKSRQEPKGSTNISGLKRISIKLNPNYLAIDNVEENDKL